MGRAGLTLRERRRTRATDSTGFTLLEVLLTLALIGLLAGVLVLGALKMTETKPLTAEEVFWKAVAEARRDALLSGQEVRLRFVANKKSFALIATGPSGEKQYPFEGMDDVKVDFLAGSKPGSAMLIRSQLVETQTVRSVTFYGDGTCTPFRLQIRTGGPARVLSIDPWTCAPILAANETTR